MANVDNLVPNAKRSPGETREMGKKGGKRSGEVRREKKLLSDIYARVLEKKYGTSTGAELVEDVIMRIIQSKGSPAVSMLKELREAIEGSKVEHSGGISVVWQDNIPEPKQ